MEIQDGWRVQKRPGLPLQLRARPVWRAYEKAREPYDRLVRQMQTLEAEREALLRADMTRRQAGEPSDIDAVGAELLRYNRIFAELTEPWNKAEADMKRAYSAALKVLEELGFEEIPDEDPAVSRTNREQGRRCPYHED